MLYPKKLDNEIKKITAKFSGDILDTVVKITNDKDRLDFMSNYLTATICASNYLIEIIYNGSNKDISPDIADSVIELAIINLTKLKEENNL